MKEIPPQRDNRSASSPLRLLYHSGFFTTATQPAVDLANDFEAIGGSLLVESARDIGHLGKRGCQVNRRPNQTTVGLGPSQGSFKLNLLCWNSSSVSAAIETGFADMVMQLSFFVFKVYEAEYPGKTRALKREDFLPGYEQARSWTAKFINGATHASVVATEPFLLGYFFEKLGRHLEDGTEFSTQEEYDILLIIKILMLALDGPSEDESLPF